MHAKEGLAGALEQQKAHDLAKALKEQTPVVTGEAADAPPYEPAAAPKPSPAQQRQMELYQAAFDHVTTNRHQRRAREALAKKAAVKAARTAAKKARHGK